MPNSAKCPRCERLGFVRHENVIKGSVAQRQFYCGACHHSWTVIGDNDTRRSHTHGPDRSRAADDD